MKKFVSFILCIYFIFPLLAGAENPSPEETFKKSFPKNNFESISPTSIKGLYEVYTGNQIYYFLPEAEVIIYGNIISKDGVNLTRQSNLKKMAPKMAMLSLDHALKIGNGKISVIEFTDPNCPYCRQAFHFLSQRKDVTTYVFLIPLSQDSERKIRHIFCSKDKSAAYENVMAGKLDNNAKLNICNDKKAEEVMITHRRMALQTGVRATPLFFIKGQVVDGFDKTAIDNLLNN